MVECSGSTTEMGPERLKYLLLLRENLCIAFVWFSLREFRSDVGLLHLLQLNCSLAFGISFDSFRYACLSNILTEVIKLPRGQFQEVAVENPISGLIRLRLMFSFHLKFRRVLKRFLMKYHSTTASQVSSSQLPIETDSPN